MSFFQVTFRDYVLLFVVGIIWALFANIKSLPFLSSSLVSTISPHHDIKQLSMLSFVPSSLDLRLSPESSILDHQSYRAFSNLELLPKSDWSDDSSFQIWSYPLCNLDTERWNVKELSHLRSIGNCTVAETVEKMLERTHHYVLGSELGHG